ncbi:MAG: putative Ig domain-containing protein, partial [Ekhidna sp.]|nr:putative Ig domain-containing protein [Ekhidna sp.]
WTTIPGSGATTVSHTVTGLTNGTAYTFQVRAVAGSVEGVPSDERTENATGNAQLRPTVMNTIPDQTATVETAFSYQFPANTFSDADGDPLSYTATKGDGTALPTWLTFNANSRTFSGTPQAGDAGTLTVKVTATDGNGGSVSDSFDITVSEKTPLGVAAAEGISIYPNPASGHFTLTGVSKSLSGVSLVSMAGREVQHYPAAEDGKYDISALNEGIFFVFIERDQGQRCAGRIVIRRQ